MRNMLFAIVCVVVFMLWFRYFEWKNIFFPTREISQTPQTLNLAYQEVSFKTIDGVRLHGWFVPAQAGAASAIDRRTQKQITILLCHGNGGNISDRMDKIAMFYQLGCNVFLYDYRGYGKSEGRPSERGIYQDTHAAFDYLVRKKNISPKTIIIYGESLGGCVAVEVARKEKVAGLILEGAFTNTADMAKEFYPFLPAFLLSSKLDSLSKVSGIMCPVLFIHSQDDEIVPIELARKLYERAPQPKTFLEISGGHNFAVIDFQEKVTKATREFINLL